MTRFVGEAETTDVVIVGAGPVGLMLAGELRLGGAKVVVLERLAKPMTESRASTLHARTMEQLVLRGLLSDTETPPNERMGHFGGVPLNLTLSSRYPGQWKVAQVTLEQLLQAWAVAAGADIRRGHEVAALQQSSAQVEVEAECAAGLCRLRAQYLVACDGEQSTVRGLVGGAFPRTAGAPTRQSQRVLYRADIAGVDIPNRRFQQQEHGLAISARLPTGATRVMVCEVTGAGGLTEREGVRYSDVARAWQRVTGENIHGATPLWINAFSDASHQLEQYRKGRVLWAGDAAHQQMPVGGQAINLGLQDAVNLGWKLALCVRGRAPESLLDTYHKERHAVGAKVLGNIRAQAALLLGGPGMAPLRDLVRELIEFEGVRAQLAGMISGLDIRYDLEGEAHPLLGARLPEVELERWSVATDWRNTLRKGRGLLLSVADNAAVHAALALAVAPWHDVVDMVVATPHASQMSEATITGPTWAAGAAALLVRPDGYIAWADVDPNHGLRGALQRWFGSPGQSVQTRLREQEQQESRVKA